MAQRPSSIPLPAQQAPESHSPIPPTPSAFPSLSGATDAPSEAPPLPASTLHYAEVTGKVLPPTSIPKGISLPPPPHSTTSTKSTSNSNGNTVQRERHQSSGQKNRDSPYARPGPGSRSHSGGKLGAGDKRKSSKPPTTKSQPEDRSLPEGHENKHRTVPGMPPAWAAKNSKTVAAKGTHVRRKSEGFASFVSVKEKSSDESLKRNGEPGMPGKKKQKALGKTLDPTKSKLSALAPSFEFVPRSATSPNLSAYTQESSSGSGSEGPDAHRDEEAEQTSSEESSSSRQPDLSASLGSYLSSSFSLSTPSSLTSFDAATSAESHQEADPAQGLVDEKLAAETVSSAGPQADGHVGQTFTQSESGARPDADKTGFRSISGVINESPMADLQWKEKMGWWREDYEPKSAESDDVLSRGEAEKEEEPPQSAPAAVEANSNETPLLQYPPWKPSTAYASAQDNHQPILSDSKVSPAILGKALASSFSEPSFASATEASAAPSASLQSSSDSAEPASSTTATTSGTPSLSSYLPTSFTPPLSGYPATSSSFDETFLSQDELRAEKLARDGPAGPKETDSAASDMPLSAEAVAAQPTLDDALNVGQASTKEQQALKQQEEPEARRGWWNREENETEQPQPNQSEHADQLVDGGSASATVGSAGPQADEFVAKGFEEVDSVGAEGRDGEAAVKKDVEHTVSKEEGHLEVADDATEQEKNGASTPLGSFLSSAFQPTDTTFSSVSASASGEESTTASSEAFGVSTTSSKPDQPVSQPSPSLSTAATPSRRQSSSPSPPPANEPTDSTAADSAPSLTLAISSAWHTAPWSRKIWAILASVAINVGLPFVNGVMLGFGELFARNVLGVRFGWPLHNNTATTRSSTSASTGGVGLRSAGAYKASNVNAGRGVGTDVPGHAGAKTALEGVIESVAE